MPLKSNKNKSLLVELDCREPMNSILTDSEIHDVRTEFVWFFTGQNNAQPLLAQRNLKFLDVLYERYKSEIKKMRDYYGLDDIIGDAEYAHNWFSDWRKMQLFSKDQFLDKMKLNSDFAMIWADLGVTDSLEFRHWGLTVQYDLNDEATVKNAGKDQLTDLISSIISKPEDGIHCLTLLNPTNTSERTMPLGMITGQFICVGMTYEERIKWLFENNYETGMEYGILLETMKNEDLDKLKWYNDFITIPKYKLSLFSNYGQIKDRKSCDQISAFNLMFLKTMSSLLNMVADSVVLFSPMGYSHRKTNKSENVQIDVKVDQTKGLAITNENISFSRKK